MAIDHVLKLYAETIRSPYLHYGYWDEPEKINVDSLSIFYASQVDGKEGVASFLEKRDPEFKSKASTDMPDFYPWWK